jgi:hypothetical protein
MKMPVADSGCRIRPRLGLFLLLTAVVLFPVGCASKPKTPPKPPTVKVLRLTHHVGGTHYRTVVDGNYCYQTFDRRLLVMAAGEVTPLKTIELGKVGQSGPAIDMTLHPRDSGKRLWIVIEDDELLELSLELPQAPVIAKRMAAARLGIRPRRLSMVGEDLYVSGPGGVVRVRDNHKVFSSEQDISRVAQGEAGLIACADRQATRLSDGRYVGSATDFAGTAGQHLIFIRQGEAGGHVGFMTAQAREIDAHRATVAVPGQINGVRVINDRLWIASDRTIAGYRMSENTLSDPIFIDVLGATDIAALDEQLLGICGTFGRATYRLEESDKDEPPAFVKIHREPSRLSLAASDGRHILAGGAEGLWMYLINSRVDLTTRQFENAPPPPTTIASVANGAAKISDDRLSITITANAVDPVTGDKSRFTYSEAGSGTAVLIHCVEAVDGEFWIGHDRGITVLKAPPAPIDEGAPKRETQKAQQAAQQIAANRVAGRVRLDGPVLYIYPLLVGGGASFVSEFGGFGVAKFVDEPVLTPTR